MGVLLFALLGLGGMVYYGWHQIHGRYGISLLHWQGLSVHFSKANLQLEQLTLQQQDPEGAQTLFTAQQLTVHWSSFFHWPQVVIQQLDVVHHRPVGHPPLSARVLSNYEVLEQGWPFLATQWTIQNLRLDLPCATGRCQEQGSLHWQSDDQQANSTLKLEWHHEAHRMELAATTHTEDSTGLTKLQLQVALDQQPRLESHQLIEATPSGNHRWSGSVHLGAIPEAPWLLNWLSRWLPYDSGRFTRAAVTMRLGASWALEQNHQMGTPLQGEVRAALNFPTPWPIPGLGLIQGQTELTLIRQQGHWQPTTLNSDLTLQPDPEQTEYWPADLRPGHVRLKINTAPMEQSQPLLPLQASLTTQGNLRLNLQLPELKLGLHPLRLDIQNASLDLTLPRLETDQYRLKNLKIKTPLNGLLEHGHLKLHLNHASQLTLEQLQTSAFDQVILKQLRLQLGTTGLSLHAPIPFRSITDWQLGGQAQLSVDQLHHPALNPLAWTWQGQVQIKKTARSWMQAKGLLKNSADLQLTTQVTRRPDGRFKVDGHSLTSLTPTANPWALSFAQWPQALALHQGTLQIKGSWVSPQMTGGSPRAQAVLTAQHLNGQYQQTTLHDLNAQILSQYGPSGWSVELKDAQVQQLNPGIPLGPLHLVGRYQAEPQHLTQGVLSWQTAQLGIMGGQLWADPGSLDRRQPTKIPLRLEALDLAQLLAANPQLKLTGSGILDGHLELQSTTEGIHLEGGHFTARAPGRLHLHSLDIQQLIVAHPEHHQALYALSNLYYNQMSGQLVRTDKPEIMQLQLHLQGRNPRVNQGRGLHLNVLMEESIADFWDRKVPLWPQPPPLLEHPVPASE